MTTKHSITLTCDCCKAESNDACYWARIHISASSKTAQFGQDQHYDLCSDCWSKVRDVIYGRAKIEASR